MRNVVFRVSIGDALQPGNWPDLCHNPLDPPSIDQAFAEGSRPSVVLARQGMGFMVAARWLICDTGSHDIATASSGRPVRGARLTAQIHGGAS